MGAFLGGVVIALAIGAAVVFGTGWVVMITAGMVHLEVESLSAVVVPWSFRESVFVGIGLSVLGGFFYGPTLLKSD